MSAVPNKPRKKGDGVWLSLWAPVPFEESSRALQVAGTIGFAIYNAICKQRFKTAPKYRDAFFCSETNISFWCGVSPRRIREPLRLMESAGIIKISRPQGIDKVNHQASKITLVLIPVGGNMPSARQDRASCSDKTDRPVESGQEGGVNLSVNAEYPLRGGTHAATSAALGGASTVADELRGEPAATGAADNQKAPRREFTAVPAMCLKLQGLYGLSKIQAKARFLEMSKSGDIIFDQATGYALKASPPPPIGIL